MLRAGDFFDLSKCTHSALLENTDFVWDALKTLKGYLQEALDPNISLLRKKGELVNETCVLYENRLIEDFTLKTDGSKTQVVVNGEVIEGASIVYEGAVLLDDAISIGNGTLIEPGALIKGPTIIGDYTEVRQTAYVRGNVLIGDRCVVGHSTEIKNSIMVYRSKAGHFAYIGDSILGEVNLGAGTKLANLKIFNSTITVKANATLYDTGLRKMGAIIGDQAELGCNTVTSPGTVIGKGVVSYPNTSLRGYYPPHSIVKLRQVQEVIEQTSPDN